MHRPIVIVGAGHSGAKAAAALRKHGWTGPIALVGEESHAPYDRPPLSKAVLLGKRTTDECSFYPLSWFQQNGVELLLNRAVATIDRAKHEIILVDGECLPFQKLLLATGSRLNPLQVPGAELANVWPLRTPGHANGVARALQPDRSIVVIGAGVIGLEVASAARQAGCRVQVLEAAPRAMARSLPEAAASALVAEHLARGVDVRLGVAIEALLGEGAVEAVRLQTGETLPCDTVVFGVGVKPRTELAEAAGLSVHDGILTNSRLRTDDPDIFACGDVCRYQSAAFDSRLRMENWRNAEDQADLVARNMLGQDVPFDAVPWFWSNQFDFTLQVAGLPALGTSTGVEQRGDARLFLSWDDSGRLVGAAGLGMVKSVAAPLRELRAEIARSLDASRSGLPA